MWKKIIVVLSLIILALCVVFIGDVRGDESQMYAEIYDRNGVHISNVVMEKWNITKRVFEFDTSSFEGTCDDDISEGIIFIFKDDIGGHEYSGFIKNITQDDESVKFKGDDFRRVMDTQIQLDFTQTDYINQPEDEFALENIFNAVLQGVADQKPTDMTLVRYIVNDDRLTQFIANYSGQRIQVNAWKFVKVYCAFYNYYVEAWSDDGDTIRIRINSQSGTAELRLTDFVFDKTTSEVKTTHAVAQIKPVDNLKTVKAWMYSSEELWDATPASLQTTFDYTTLYPETWSPVNFEDSFDDFPQNQVIRVQLWDGTPYEDNLLRTFYMQPMMNYYAIATDLVFIEYWLGNDNEIYYNSIPAAKEIIPAITKIFESEYLSSAQYEAVWELVNSRYIEYIILTDSTYIPLDIKEFELYQMITVFDSEGTSRVVPVSEIKWTQDDYQVKLGFKKTLLTEIIKN